MEAMPNYLVKILDKIPQKFELEFLIGAKTSRQRAFNPRSFILCLMHLCSGTNEEGYHQALIKTFDDLKAPSKGALSYLRPRISFKFFKSVHETLLDSFGGHELLYEGYRLIAIDGWQITLPRTKDIIDHDFTGRATSKHRESYMPKGFVVAAYDVLNKLTLSLSLNASQTEMEDARSILPDLPEKVICLYDRLWMPKTTTTMGNNLFTPKF